ncbi:hypothetical protein B0T14DRAFT_594261 [Immersiella caudata]|uniref:Uncharacterized protein n=1 Tax=Immersiella caudata TaxID=314043 RepID=A0AA39W4C6_9PEZI|nr:hypothetical protein B0T14DRAFT_594261 [Immersiella caudata]
MFVKSNTPLFHSFEQSFNDSSTPSSLINHALTTHPPRHLQSPTTPHPSSNYAMASIQLPLCSNTHTVATMELLPQLYKSRWAPRPTEGRPACQLAQSRWAPGPNEASVQVKMASPSPPQPPLTPRKACPDLTKASPPPEKPSPDTAEASLHLDTASSGTIEALRREVEALTRNLGDLRFISHNFALRMETVLPAFRERVKELEEELEEACDKTKCILCCDETGSERGTDSFEFHDAFQSQYKGLSSLGIRARSVVPLRVPVQQLRACAYDPPARTAPQDPIAKPDGGSNPSRGSWIFAGTAVEKGKQNAQDDATTEPSPSDQQRHDAQSGLLSSYVDRTQSFFVTAAAHLPSRPSPPARNHGLEPSHSHRPRNSSNFFEPYKPRQRSHPNPTSNFPPASSTASGPAQAHWQPLRQRRLVPEPLAPAPIGKLRRFALHAVQLLRKCTTSKAATTATETRKTVCSTEPAMKLS